jgi:hypothetical protein
VEHVSGWDDNAGTTTRPIGDVLDSLGIEATVEPGELVAGAVVLLKVVQTNGETRLSLTHQGIGWIERVPTGCDRRRLIVTLGDRAMINPTPRRVQTILLRTAGEV